MLARKTSAAVLAASIFGALTSPVFAAGQGLSDRIARCVPEPNAPEQVSDLTDEIAKAEQNPAQLFDLYVERGRARIANCDLTAALADFDRAERAKPPSLPFSTAFYIGRGDAHLRLEERHDALADYDAALARNLTVDEEAHVRQMRGFIRTDQGEETLAIAEFTRVIELKPDYADAYWLRGVSYENINDYRSALADYDRLARLRPNDWTGWSQICWGHAYLNSGLEDGLRACNMALRLNPTDPNALDGRGFINVRLGKFTEAVKSYDEALKLQPRLPGALYLRGIAKLRLGNAAGAKNDIAAAEAFEQDIASRFAGYGITP
jgi:tetratricopeptide (TPR) repeat protein